MDATQLSLPQAIRWYCNTPFNFAVHRETPLYCYYSALSYYKAANRFDTWDQQRERTDPEIMKYLLTGMGNRVYCSPDTEPDIYRLWYQFLTNDTAGYDTASPELLNALLEKLCWSADPNIRWLTWHQCIPRNISMNELFETYHRLCLPKKAFSPAEQWTGGGARTGGGDRTGGEALCRRTRRRWKRRVH